MTPFRGRILRGSAVVAPRVVGVMREPGDVSPPPGTEGRSSSPKPKADAECSWTGAFCLPADLTAEALPPADCTLALDDGRTARIRIEEVDGNLAMFTRLTGEA